MKSSPLVMERVYDAPAKVIWDALTDHQKMKQWYFDIKEFKPEVGFEFSFLGGKDGREYRHLCEIKEVIPGKKLTYSWKYENYPGESYVSFELFPEGDKTRLKLTHEGLETFPQENPDFAKENFIMGWEYITGTSLKNFVEKMVV